MQRKDDPKIVCKNRKCIYNDCVKNSCDERQVIIIDGKCLSAALSKGNGKRKSN